MDRYTQRRQGFLDRYQPHVPLQPRSRASHCIYHSWRLRVPGLSRCTKFNGSLKQTKIPWPVPKALAIILPEQVHAKHHRCWILHHQLSPRLFYSLPNFAFHYSIRFRQTTGKHSLPSPPYALVFSDCWARGRGSIVP